ncbi:MAG: hypothetical protein JST40_08330 [Armatimonadetes bacterium]|nr:hypothetical protein [Armatimonadota bacterium]
MIKFKSVSARKHLPHAALAAGVISLVSSAHGQDPGSILPGAGPEPTSQTTFLGPSGLIHVPTAYTVLPGRFRLGANFERDRQSLVGNYGIFRDVEVGGGWIERNGRDGKAIANAKVRIQPANFRNVDIGIGVADAFDAVTRSVFAIASIDVIPPDVNVEGYRSIGLKLHGGYGTGVYNKHLIGGAELSFTKDLSLIGEYDGDLTNFAVRFSRTSEFSMQAGVANKRLFFGFVGGFRL